MSIESLMPSNHLILCQPLLLLPPSFPSIRVFSNVSVVRVRWTKYWSFTFSNSPSSEHSGLISVGWTGCISTDEINTPLPWRCFCKTEGPFSLLPRGLSLSRLHFDFSSGLLLSLGSIKEPSIQMPIRCLFGGASLLTSQCPGSLI